MLGFIIGTNEDARRKALYEQMADFGGEGYLIVPEQFSFESEKMLSETLGSEKAQHFEVLGFSRLCNSIFRTFGGIAGTYCDDGAKLLIMGAALAACGDDLCFYKKKIQGASFIEKLVQTDTEMKNAGVFARELSAVAESEPDSVLGQKSADLAEIFSLYDAMLTKSWLDPLTDISRAEELLSEKDFFGGKAVFVDNFTGFTGSQYKLLRAVLAQCSQMCVSLCCDTVYDKTGGTGLFSKTQRTAGRLIRMAKELSVTVKAPVVAAPEEENRPAGIVAVESGFLQNKMSTGNMGEVRIIRAENPYDEADFVALELRRLAEHGLRWREATVIARDIAPYEHALRSSFKKAGIPLYMDEAVSLSAHPLCAFVSASLSACRSSFALSDILRILKTGLLPVSPEDCAEFENYCFTWNIRGKMFLSDFTGNPEGFKEPEEKDFESLPRINEVRKIISVPLAKLQNAIKDPDGAEFSDALYKYLTECKITEGLSRLYDEYTEKGDIYEAELLDSFWSYLVSCLDKFSASLGDVRLGQKNMIRLFEMLMEKSGIGSLPKTLDCVAAGSANRARPGNIKAAFIIGVCDGTFPEKPKTGGLFSDAEKKLLKEQNIELGEDSNDAVLSERMYAYTAFTCPSEKLYVSYPAYDEKFKEQTPSVLISRIKSAVTPVFEQRTKELPLDFRLCTDEFAFDLLAGCGRNETGESLALKEYFSEKEDWCSRAELIGKMSHTYEAAIENKAVSEKLFGNRLRLSPTRIETFENCPFEYFLKNGIKLKERRKAELDPLSTGTLIHFALQQIIGEHGGKGISALSDEKLHSEIETVLNDYLETVFGKPEGKSERFMYLFRRIKGFLFRLLRRIGEEFAMSQFEPYAFEVPLGDDSEVGEYRLTTPEGRKISVTGQIDRVDVLNKNGSRYVRVVDYKTGSKEFKLNDVFYGINIQMLVYLFSVWNSGRGGLKNSVPAGVLYMPAKDFAISGERNMTGEDAQKKQNEKFRMNGLLLEDEEVLNAMEPGLSGLYIPAKTGKNGVSGSLATLEEFGKIKSHIDKLLMDMANSLADGKIGAKPYKKGDFISCENCVYNGICRRTKNDPVIEHEDFKDTDFYQRLEMTDRE